jgi:hypothetical protein
MFKSKVVRILKTFSAIEIRAFRDFVASPYFNKKPDLIRLVDIICEQVPEKDPGQLSKERIYGLLYPGKPYDDKDLRYLKSDLTRLAERFMVISRYEEAPIRRDLDLLSCFLDRSLEKEYWQTRSRLQRLFQDTVYHDSSFFYQKLRFADVEERRFQEQRKRTFDDAIQHASNYLDCFYFIKKLKYCCGMLDRQSIFKGEYQLNLSPKLIAHVKGNDFFNEELIFYYYNVLMALMEEDNDAYFDRLRNLLSEPTDKISREELRELYLAAINYCARKIRKGRETYVSEALNLYREGINRNILIEDNQLSPWTFTNVVKLALRLKEYGWIEGFIKKYSHLLPEKFREDALHYNLAELYYYTRDFDKAMLHLNQVRLSDLNYHLGSRVILSKIYYESKEEEALLSLIAAFSIFLKRNKAISNNLKKTYLNFCDILFQILKNNPKKMGTLEEKIRQTELLTDRGWLLKIFREASAAA